MLKNNDCARSSLYSLSLCHCPGCASPLEREEEKTAGGSAESDLSYDKSKNTLGFHMHGPLDVRTHFLSVSNPKETCYAH